MPADPKKSKLFANDRGRAQYFHGRSDIIWYFNAVCRRSLEDQDGTTFLIQGPPGVGKTALLHELSAQAAKEGWLVLRTTRRTFEDPDVLIEALGKAYTSRASAHSFLGGFWAKVKLERENRGYRSVWGVLRSVDLPDQGLLLVLDEAQQLSGLDKLEVGDAFQAIHNGALGRPVILLAAGVSRTLRMLNGLWISRYSAHCLHDLGRLSAESERAIIRDWLIKGGKAKGEVGSWIEAIAQETNRWPHHIASFGDMASQVIRQAGGVMTPQGLARALDEGRRHRDRYCEQRCDGMAWEDQALLGTLVKHGGQGRVWGEESIYQLFDIRKRSSGASCVDVTNAAIASGVLAPARMGLRFPIPSMEDWLVGRYERYLISRPAEARALTDGLQPVLPAPWVSTKSLPPTRDSGQQKPPPGLTSGFGSPEDGIGR